MQAGSQVVTITSAMITCCYLKGGLTLSKHFHQRAAIFCRFTLSLSMNGPLGSKKAFRLT